MLKETEKYWIGKNNNKWDKKYYTKKQAEKASESLINCTNCEYCQVWKSCQVCNNGENCEYFKNN